MHPVRGRKPAFSDCIAVLLRKQLTPRQGTKTIFGRSTATMRFESKQLTPRQGTKTPFGKYQNFLFSCETTYTPPGDENVIVITSFHFSVETTYTPPGDENFTPDSCTESLVETTYAPPGDENVSYQYKTSANTKQLTPRQGTKTSSKRCTRWIFRRNNLHPARGRKKLLTHVDKEQKEIDTYETYFI